MLMRILRTGGTSTRRYTYAFGIGFLCGVVIYLTGHTFLYSVSYTGNQAYYLDYQFTTRPARRPTRPWRGHEPPLTITTTMSNIPRAADDEIYIPAVDEFGDPLASGIPRIIHQTWENTSIPTQLSKWVSSWQETHTDWTYLLWTPEGAQKLINNRYTKYSVLYNNYPTKLQRADVRRYFILYEYGGVFTDLDMESFRPLDRLLTKHSCIIAQEPEIHRALLYDQDYPFIPMPGFMACRPKHPFLRFIIELLSDYVEGFYADALRSTGPFFLRDALDIYLSEYNKTAEEYVKLAPADWFLPTYDPMQEKSFHLLCSNLYNKLPKFKQLGCDILQAQNYTNIRPITSYTDHHWAHMSSHDFNSTDGIYIKDIIKTADVV